MCCGLQDNDGEDEDRDDVAEDVGGPDGEGVRGMAGCESRLQSCLLLGSRLSLGHDTDYFSLPTDTLQSTRRHNSDTSRQGNHTNIFSANWHSWKGIIRGLTEH